MHIAITLYGLFADYAQMDSSCLHITFRDTKPDLYRWTFNRSSLRFFEMIFLFSEEYFLSAWRPFYPGWFIHEPERGYYEQGGLYTTNSPQYGCKNSISITYIVITSIWSQDMHTSYLSILVHRRIIEVYKKYTKKLSELATK